MKKPITKNVEKEIVGYEVHHPAGHIYQVKNIDPTLIAYGCSKEDLERKGWQFKERKVK